MFTVLIACIATTPISQSLQNGYVQYLQNRSNGPLYV